MELMSEVRIKQAGKFSLSSSTMCHVLYPHRTPVTIAKKEKIAKFICDLITDQEDKNLLMTEADYGAPNAVDEEITSLYPINRGEARVQILNEWNANDLLSDSEEEEERESSIDTNSSDYGSAHKDSSFQTACWGHLSNKEDIDLILSDDSETTLEPNTCKENISNWDEGCTDKNGSSGSVSLYTDANEQVEEYHEASEGENTLANNKNVKPSVSYRTLLSC